MCQCQGMADVVASLVRRQPSIIEQRSRLYKSAMAITLEHSNVAVCSRLVAALKTSQASDA